MVQQEIDEGLTNDETHLSGTTRIVASVTARTLEHSNIRRPLQDEIPGHSVWDDSVQVPKRDFAVHCDAPSHEYERQHVALLIDV